MTGLRRGSPRARHPFGLVALLPSLDTCAGDPGPARSRADTGRWTSEATRTHARHVECPLRAVCPLLSATAPQSLRQR